MPRYFTTRACIVPEPLTAATWWSDDDPLLPALSVCDHEASDTGLVDLRGDPIMRAANPVGFGKDEEW